MDHFKKWWWVYWSADYLLISLVAVFFGWEIKYQGENVLIEIFQLIWLAPMCVWAFYLTYKVHRNENVKDKKQNLRKVSKK